MNRDDIIRMAREAGYIPFELTPLSTLERFANLVAAAEREECAALCDGVDRLYINQADKCAERIRSKGDQS